MMEQLEMADAPPDASCSSLLSAGRDVGPRHLRLSFLLTLFPAISASNVVFLVFLHANIL